MRGKGRVFVFDDDADSLQSVVAALRRDGFDVFPFADPREGLARVEAEGGDVIVTDLRMPGLPRCERVTGLSRLVLSLATSPAMTASEQWFERTLDDSANKRLLVPECFLATDGMLQIVAFVARGLVVYPGMIRAHIDAELPFMATEDILMAAVSAGGVGLIATDTNEADAKIADSAFQKLLPVDSEVAR